MPIMVRTDVLLSQVVAKPVEGDLPGLIGRRLMECRSVVAREAVSALGQGHHAVTLAQPRQRVVDRSYIIWRYRLILAAKQQQNRLVDPVSLLNERFERNVGARAQNAPA